MIRAYILMAAVVLFTAAAMAEVPHVITYQGHLVDSLGRRSGGFPARPAKKSLHLRPSVVKLFFLLQPS